MGMNSEKAMKEMNKFLDQYADENMSDADMNNLLQKFVGEYNETLHEVTEENAETSDDYLELAENAKVKKDKLKYAKKALKLDEDNIDAKVMVEKLMTEHPHEMIEKYQQLIEYAEGVMEKKGYMDEDSIGNYWGITATRPFIRLYYAYMDFLKDCGMMHLAANAGEEIIRYNENDNMGVRYNLMHIYALLEDEKSMLALHKKYDKHEETQMLLPMSMMYYKIGCMDKAEEYLERLCKSNKDTGRFFRAIEKDNLEKYISRMNPMGYRPFSIEEFLIEVEENEFLFENTVYYFDWALTMIRKKSR